MGNFDTVVAIDQAQPMITGERRLSFSKSTAFWMAGVFGAMLSTGLTAAYTIGKEIGTSRYDEQKNRLAAEKK